MVEPEGSKQKKWKEIASAYEHLRLALNNNEGPAVVDTRLVGSRTHLASGLQVRCAIRSKQWLSQAATPQNPFQITFAYVSLAAKIRRNVRVKVLVTLIITPTLSSLSWILKAKAGAICEAIAANRLSTALDKQQTWAVNARESTSRSRCCWVFSSHEVFCFPLGAPSSFMLRPAGLRPAVAKQKEKTLDNYLVVQRKGLRAVSVVLLLLFVRRMLLFDLICISCSLFPRSMPNINITGVTEIRSLCKQTRRAWAPYYFW